MAKKAQEHCERREDDAKKAKKEEQRNEDVWAECGVYRLDQG